MIAAIHVELWMILKSTRCTVYMLTFQPYFLSNISIFNPHLATHNVGYIFWLGSPCSIINIYNILQAQPWPVVFSGIKAGKICWNFTVFTRLGSNRVAKQKRIPDELSETLGIVGSGERIWTSDLRVMSLKKLKSVVCWYSRLFLCFVVRLVL